MPGSVLRFTFCLIGWLPELAGQEAHIRVRSQLVQVPVSVTAKDGRNVEGLTARDFRVLDDGLERAVTADVFDRGAAHISLVIAIQTSAVPVSAMEEIGRIGAMIQPLVIGRLGEAAVVTFDRDVKWLQDFTRDPRALQRSVKDLKRGSPIETHLLDAVAGIADRMRYREGRKVLLLIAEGHDSGSDTVFDDALDAVERENIEVFGAHYAPDAAAGTRKSKDINVVRALTDATGGSDFRYSKQRGIEKAIENLGVEVHSQYILSFPQPAGEAGIHQISVAVPNRGDVLVRARQAYWTDTQ